MYCASLDDVLSKVSERAAYVEGPIIGQRLNDETVKEGRLPTATDIDDVISDRPVLLYRYCGHIAIQRAVIRPEGEAVGPGEPDIRSVSYVWRVAAEPPVTDATTDEEPT